MCEENSEILNLFSQYGNDNPFKKEESNKNTGYCDKCFPIKEKELDDMVYKK
jgi:hypothetical protein